MKHSLKYYFRLAVLCTICLAPRALPAQPSAASSQAGDLERWLAHAEAQLPREAAGFETSPLAELKKSAAAIEQWAAQMGRFEPSTSTPAMHQTIDRLLVAKQQVDRLLEQTLKLRADFPGLEGDDRRRTAIRNYLAVCSQWIDLSGRLRSVLNDTINAAAFRVASQPRERERLIDLLIARKSSIGADVMSLALFDPPANTPNRAQPATPAVKEKLLDLIAVTGQSELMPRLAEFARSLQTTPPLLVSAAETIRQIGLPQDERPSRDATLPKPPITARGLHELLSKIPDQQLDAPQRSRRDELLQWLDQRAKKGLTEDSYRLGSFDVRPGDWLLMRNPSPYNLFTDLSPGLFTHVGVVAMETGSDGLRRMVLVDLPERGTSMPATNVEVFVQRTLHYMFLRHEDMQAARTMGETAASVIGNPTEFDLNFRTDRVNSLKDGPLAGQKICTYCAGLLWLCAQRTDLPRGEFFPLAEGVAGGNTAENLARLGMSLGKDFISPTGALFSAKLQIVGRREPMYDPRREVEEAIYDYFAAGLETKSLSVSPDLYQSLRLKLAEASKTNALLAQALAGAAGVNHDVDLVAAARAAAVVETLDEVAYGNSGDFRAAFTLLAFGFTEEQLKQRGATATELEQSRLLRRRHADLVQRLQRERMLPRTLRQMLVDYYIARGKAQLDQRFFARR